LKITQKILQTKIPPWKILVGGWKNFRNSGASARRKSDRCSFMPALAQQDISEPAPDFVGLGAVKRKRARSGRTF
jgi:hypothetical protein